MHIQTKQLCRWTALSLTLLAVASAQAGFQYNRSDLMIGFRVTPSSGISSSYELVIDGGCVTNYAHLPVGTKITVTNLTSGFLANAFADLNNLSWSAFADVSTNSLSAGATNYPADTLWISNPRMDFNAQTTPWNRRSVFGQGNTVSVIEGMGNNSTTYGSTHPAGTDTNTTTGILLPAGNAMFSYSAYIGSAGNLSGNFPGNIEQVTSATFTTDGSPVRSDLYLLLPGSGTGTYLGYFELSPSGVLTYTAGPSSVVPLPSTITSIVHGGTTNSITFTTATGVNYTLVGSTDLTIPLSSWPAIGSPVSGTGSPMSLPDNDGSAQKFYSIKATAP